MPIRLLHISDLHCGPHYVQEAGRALLDKARELAPDLIVASGDFTHRARPDQFAAARSLLDKLPRVPIAVVPGNHDVPLYRALERLREPYRNYCQAISPELDTVISVDGAMVVALNTTAPWRAIIEGRIRSRQLDLCQRAFSTAPPGAIRILVAHHNFAHAPDYQRDYPIRGAKKALARLTEMRVELILGGHLHRAYTANSLDVLKHAPNRRRILIVHSGTTTSSRGRARERGKNSFNFLEIERTCIRVTQHMFVPEFASFEPQCWCQYLRHGDEPSAERPK